jgi:hypothetical protein
MTAEIWISGASAVVALAALGLAIWEGSANRRHNRLSLLPRVRLDLDVNPQERSVTISLNNAGLGPAVFDSVEPMLDGKLAAERGIHGIGDVAVEAGIEGSLRYATVLVDEVLTQGSSLELLTVLESSFDEYPDQDYEAAFRRIGVRVRYRSVYEERFVYEGHGYQFLGRDGGALPPPGKVAVPALVGGATDEASARPDVEHQLATPFPPTP